MNKPRKRSIRVVETPDGRKDIAIDEPSPVIAHDATHAILIEITVHDYRPGEVIGSLHVQQTHDGPEWNYGLDHKREWRAHRG